jgi:hypothetical protein
MIKIIVGSAIGFLVGQMVWEGMLYASHWAGRLVVRRVVKMAIESKEVVHDVKSNRT